MFVTDWRHIFIAASVLNESPRYVPEDYIIPDMMIESPSQQQQNVVVSSMWLSVVVNVANTVVIGNFSYSDLHLV